MVDVHQDTAPEWSPSCVPDMRVWWIGNAVVLLPTDAPWQFLFDALTTFSEDTQIVREPQSAPQERAAIE